MYVIMPCRTSNILQYITVSGQSAARGGWVAYCFSGVIIIIGIPLSPTRCLYNG